ncbi:hypothetical protein GCM10011371_06770 [Novosphingobium marinum]|uniref:Uncharacterized protein n=1 Tax=Novosphingobium marinum TaxID=1514948 RepID=A0A7Y9XVX6_9SPHN|nr:hypothetical protein [Novosphingobium marinum]NYH94365.1 hypothetical protein [Novosphingobium marinum]GGC21787.1 hypothetical protein GCM10011371_06770 [Novosphingobium marinum]
MQIDVETDRQMISATRRGRRPWIQLLSAILKLAGPRAELLRHSEKPWASVTFSGTRHTIELTFAGAEAVEAGESFIAALPDHEFEISGQLVADATVTSVDHTGEPAAVLTVACELLLLEDA